MNISKLAILMVFVASNTIAGEAIVIDVPGAPLAIQNYEATYQEDSRYSREGIRHSVSITNNGDQDVLAYGIGFFAFDAFNENMGRPLNGIDMDTISVGSSSPGAWIQSPPSSFTFRNYGTGVSYVRIARMADGSVWEADMDYVLSELQKIESDLLLEDIINE